jgi:hypothetical protein
MVYAHTKGTIISIQKQYHVTLIDDKPMSKYDLFVTIHPYLIKTKYRVGDKVYVKKTVLPTKPKLNVGNTVVVRYNKSKPNNCIILY